jgi:hypothetical protein
MDERPSWAGIVSASRTIGNEGLRGYGKQQIHAEPTTPSPLRRMSPDDQQCVQHT